jgi:hypothetical protein
MQALKKNPVREFILTVFRSLFLLPVIAPAHSRLDKARSFSLFTECMTLSAGRDELLLIRMFETCDPNRRIIRSSSPTGAAALIPSFENDSVESNLYSKSL